MDHVSFALLLNFCVIIIVITIIITIIIIIIIIIIILTTLNPNLSGFSLAQLIN